MSDLPDTLCEAWLSGGDERLRLDPVSGLNRYGHAPQPLPQALAFGSSTASTPSAGAFQAAEALHGQLSEALKSQDARRVYAGATDAIRDQIRAGMGLQDTDIILAASGTDLHLLVSQLLGGPYDKPLRVLAPGANETGSGVGLAVSGRHFMASGRDGRSVIRGEELSLGERSETFEFTMRDEEGALRSAAAIEAELAAAISAAIAHGQRCLLVVTDVSKTGLITPGLSSVLRLRQRFADLDIMIDACQCRLAPETIRAYLQQNFLVAITGSKFLGGPVFSGALLCSPLWSKRLRHKTLHPCLGDYSARADWPADWAARRALGEDANWGLLLRWQAALFELQALHAIPAMRLIAVTAAFAEAIQARLQADPAFAAIATVALDRSAIHIGEQGFDALPTIFPFQLRLTGRSLTFQEMIAVHQGLTARVPGPVHLGQPIQFGRDSAILRLCLSAPLLVRATLSQAGLETVIAEAMAALDHTAKLAMQIVRDEVQESQTPNPITYPR